MVATHDKTQVRGDFLPEVPDLQLPGAGRPAPTPQTRNRARDPQPKHPARASDAPNATGAAALVVNDFDEFSLGEQGFDTSVSSDWPRQGQIDELDFDGTPTVGVTEAGVEVSDGDGFDTFGFDDLDDSSAALELGEARVEARAILEPHQRQLTCESPNRAALKLPQAIIAELSGYGTVPSSALLTPIYAVRVTLRRRKLAVEVTKSEQSFAESELERDRLLASVVQRMRNALDVEDRFTRALDEVDALAKRLDALGDQLVHLEGGHAKLMAELSARGSEARQSFERAQQAENALSTELETAQRNLARAEAHRKRLDIEFRNAEKRTATGAASPPEQSAVEIVARMEALEPELRATRDASTATKKRLDASRSTTRKAEGELVRRETEVRRADQGLARKRMTGIATVRDEETVWVTAMANVMRSVLVAPGRLKLEEGDLRAFYEADVVVAERAMVAERYARAYHSHDPAAVKRGLLVLGIAVLLLAALLVWLDVS